MLTLIGVILGIVGYYPIYKLLNKRTEENVAVNRLIAAFCSSIIIGIFTGIGKALLIGAEYLSIPIGLSIIPILGLIWYINRKKVINGILIGLALYFPTCLLIIVLISIFS